MGIRHPLFARCYARLAPSMERAGVAEHRRELLTGVRGRVVEIGAGTGLTFAHYPPEVEEVVAVEPEPYLRARATEAARGADVPIRVMEAVGDDLPFTDGEFDAAVMSLVLCSVSDQVRTLREVRRVLRDRGALHFYEHVRSDESRHARVQDAIDVVWPLAGGGCHTGRDTPAAIEAAGFSLERIRRFDFRPTRLAYPVSPHVIGVARKGVGSSESQG